MTWGDGPWKVTRRLERFLVVRYVNLYAKNSENGEQSAHLIYEGVDHRSPEFNTFKEDI
jgi:hypothetical protein